jgi:hypothetical protein
LRERVIRTPSTPRIRAVFITQLSQCVSEQTGE